MVLLDELKKLVLEAADEFKNRSLKIATAESCTGGGLSYWLTSVPGSSDWLERGFVTYSDAAKVEMLGVSTKSLESFGAVSEQVAREMAEGALKKSYANLSIAITGIAGPAGGTTDKPVGTVWIAWSSTHFQTFAELNLFSGDRQAIRIQTMQRALQKCLALLK